MTSQLDFIKERDAGFTRFGIVRNYQLPMGEIMSRLGLEANPDGLREVAPQVAIESVASLLWKDMAYGHELMPLEKATAYAKTYIEQFNSDQVHFFTNGSWHDYHRTSSSASHPLTSATFSAVILAIHDQFAACLVFEDAD